jgi:hypothetical protein
MQLSISLRRVATVLVWVLVVLAVAGIFAECARNLLGSKSPLVDYFSLTEEKNFPTWWSSFLLATCSIVLGTIAATKSRRPGDYKAHWIGLTAIFCYLSIDEFVEIHEWLSALPGLGKLHGFLYYGWVLPAVFVVAAFALSYLRFLFHLPMSTRVKVALAGVLYVGGALGLELILGVWTERHGEFNFAWAMIGVVEESMEIIGSSLFLYALLEYLGRTAPDLRIAVRSGRD